MPDNLSGEELSKWAAVEIMDYELADDGRIFNCWITGGSAPSPEYDEIKDWKPHLDDHLGQTFQCLEKFQKDGGWDIAFIGKDADDEDWDCELSHPEKQAVLAQGKILPVVILQALWLAAEGEKNNE